MEIRATTFEDGSRTAYVHDRSGRLERMEDYDADGALVMSVDYVYNPDGQNVERVVRDGRGRQIRRLEFEYGGDSGPPVVYREYDANDALAFEGEAKDV